MAAETEGSSFKETKRLETGLEKMMLLNKVLLIYFAFICLKAEKNVWIIFN